jgi:hypothetical protein
MCLYSTPSCHETSSIFYGGYWGRLENNISLDAAAASTNTRSGAGDGAGSSQHEEDPKPGPIWREFIDDATWQPHVFRLAIRPISKSLLHSWPLVNIEWYFHSIISLVWHLMINWFKHSTYFIKYNWQIAEHILPRRFCSEVMTSAVFSQQELQ